MPKNSGSNNQNFIGVKNQGPQILGSWTLCGRCSDDVLVSGPWAFLDWFPAFLEGSVGSHTLHAVVWGSLEYRLASG